MGMVVCMQTKGEEESFLFLLDVRVKEAPLEDMLKRNAQIWGGRDKHPALGVGGVVGGTLDKHPASL